MGESEVTIKVIVAFLNDPRETDRLLHDVEELRKTLALEILEVAVISREEESQKLAIEDYSEPTARKGAIRGAVAGGIIGLVFPPSILAMGAVGAAAGAALRHFTDQGFDDNLLKEIGENLPPGGSAVVVVVDEAWGERLTQTLSGYSDLSQFTLGADAAAKLTAKIKK